MAIEKLTNKQRDVQYALDLMKKGEGYVVRKHKQMNGKVCYRLIDASVHPVLNLDKDATEEMIDLGRLIKKENGVWILNKNYNDGTLRLSRSVSE